MVAAAITLARPNGDIVVSPGWRQACGDPSSAAHRAASAEVLGGTSLSATRSHTFVGAPPTTMKPLCSAGRKHAVPFERDPVSWRTSSRQPRRQTLNALGFPTLFG
jgi:hypothetical protein